jgi:hypothetical protein
MKIRIVANNAGTEAAKTLQNGFFPKGGMNHPLSLDVGANFSGTVSFGVLIPVLKSIKVMAIMAKITAKSDTIYLNQVGKKGETRNSLSIVETKKVPAKRRRLIKKTD